MKKIILMGLISLGAAQLASADVVLAGWDSFYSITSQTNGQAADIKVDSFARLFYDDPANAKWVKYADGSTDGDWGNYNDGVNPPLSDGTGNGLKLGGVSGTPSTMEFKITANGAQLTLNEFHFDYWVAWNKSYDVWSLDVIAGATTNNEVSPSALTHISDLNGGAGKDPSLGDTDYLDISYTLTNSVVLNDGESATFLFTLDGATGGAASYFDNFAISGTASAIPEPATLGLIGVASLGILFIRRRMML